MGHESTTNYDGGIKIIPSRVNLTYIYIYY